jgi:type I restriction-modification system DNA methylase subunit
MEKTLIDSLLFRLEAPHPELVKEIVYSIPEKTIIDPESKFLDPAMGGGHFLRAIHDRAVELGVSSDSIKSRLYGIERSIVYTNYARWKVGLEGANLRTSGDYDLPLFGMKFDVIVGNPPYNNEGKIKGSKQTSGTSLWLKFLKVIPALLREGGFCSLVLPAAVGNTNSQGWRSLRECRVTSLITGVGRDFFRVGTEISVISFTKESPTAAHLVNGIPVNREQVPILPASCSEVSLSIFSKICSQEMSLDWKRDNWPVFEEKSKGKSVVGMSFLDRSKVYKVQTLDDLSKRPLKKVNICWTETEKPEEVIRLMSSRLISFYAEQTMMSGNLSVGMVRAITVPSGWQDLKTEEDFYGAYGLTQEEIHFLEDR